MIAPPRGSRAWLVHVMKLQLARQTPEQRTAHLQAFAASRQRLLGRLRMIGRGLEIDRPPARRRCLGLALEIDVERIRYQGAGVHTVERLELEPCLGWTWHRAELRHSIILGPAWLLLPWRLLSRVRGYLVARRSSPRT